MKMVAAIAGMMVTAMKREASNEMHTVSESGRASLPAILSERLMGRKTATVVSVLAVMARPTSEAPITAASCRGDPSSRWRKVFSITTTALSTSRPTPSAMPPRVIMLKVYPMAFIPIKVVTTDRGIASAMVIVGLTARRKMKMTPMAMMLPTSALLPVDEIERRITLP